MFCHSLHRKTPSENSDAPPPYHTLAPTLATLESPPQGGEGASPVSPLVLSRTRTIFHPPAEGPSAPSGDLEPPPTYQEAAKYSSVTAGSLSVGSDHVESVTYQEAARYMYSASNTDNSSRSTYPDSALYATVHSSNGENSASPVYENAAKFGVARPIQATTCPDEARASVDHVGYPVYDQAGSGRGLGSIDGGDIERGDSSAMGLGVQRENSDRVIVENELYK